MACYDPFYGEYMKGFFTDEFAFFNTICNIETWLNKSRLENYMDSRHIGRN